MPQFLVVCFSDIGAGDNIVLGKIKEIKDINSSIQALKDKKKAINRQLQIFALSGDSFESKRGDTYPSDEFKDTLAPEKKKIN